MNFLNLKRIIRAGDENLKRLFWSERNFISRSIAIEGAKLAARTSTIQGADFWNTTFAASSLNTNNSPATEILEIVISALDSGKH